MKFGDVVMAVASLTVVDVLVDFVLLAAFIPTVGSYWAPDVAGIVAALVASLVVGYVFAGQIREARMSSIGRIAVLSTVVLMFATMALFANPYASDAMKESLESTYSTNGWTTWDWVVYSQMMMVMLVALNVVFALVFSFIGLYAGSMLRRPKKS